MSIAVAGPQQAQLMPTSWSADPEMPLSAWAAYGAKLGALGRSAGWWIGDWLRFGNLKFGERYTRAAKITGYDVQTLMNMVYVASRFEFSRRRENLSWSHHAELAALDPGEQDRWLDEAERQRMSVRCMRTEARRAALARRKRGDGDAPDGACPGTGTADAAGLAHDDDLCPMCGAPMATPEREETR
jgi:hypothetical protein